MSLLALPARAVPVTYDFAGEITFTSQRLPSGVDNDAERVRLLSLLPGSLGGGNSLFYRPFSGSFPLDSAAGTDLYPNPMLGRYEGFDVLSAFSVVIEGFEFALDPMRMGDVASADVLDGLNVDAVTLVAMLSPGLLPYLASSLSIELTFYLFTAGRDVLDSDRPPADLSLVDGYASVGIEFIDPAIGSAVGYGSQFSSLTLTRRVNVPEAGTNVLFAIGMASLWWFAAGRRRRNPARMAI
jgi:hypothetical protein